MFTYLKLKNFKSFGDINFDFRSKAKEAKPLAVIYGENGCGKSNFVAAYDFLCESIVALNDMTQKEELVASLNEKADIEKMTDINGFFGDMLSKIQFLSRDFSGLMKTCKRIGCKDLTELEFGFLLNGIEGYYRISFDSEVRKEELYYLIKDRRGVLFCLNNDDNDRISVKLSGNVIDAKYEEEIKGLIDRFWGKYTFLAILFNETRSKNRKFIISKINNNLLDVIELFRNTIVICRNPSSIIQRICGREDWLANLERGKVSREREYVIDKFEELLRDFYTQAYADIKDVYYTKKEVEDAIEYELYVKKMIAGNLTDINFRIESSGTRRILDNMTALLGAMQGTTVVIDEVDNGVHDILMRNIISSLADEIEGQLIMTTHNTLLLEELSSKDAYVIAVDYNGNKQAECLANFMRIQKNHNLRELYNRGVFGGVPYNNGIDFGLIKQELHEPDVPCLR